MGGNRKAAEIEDPGIRWDDIVLGSALEEMISVFSAKEKSYLVGVCVC